VFRYGDICSSVVIKIKVEDWILNKLDSQSYVELRKSKGYSLWVNQKQYPFEKGLMKEEKHILNLTIKYLEILE